MSNSISFKEILAFLIGFTISSLIVISVARNYTYIKTRYNLNIIKKLNEPAKNLFLRYENFGKNRDWNLKIDENR